MQPATTPRDASGRVTVKKARKGDAPSVRRRHCDGIHALDRGARGLDQSGSAPRVAASTTPVRVNTMGEPKIDLETPRR